MIALPIGFHTAPYNLFFKEEPDYSSISSRFEMLDFISQMDNTSICVLDFYKHEYAYISRNHLFLCGYSINESKHLGEKLAEMIIYDEDKVHQAKMKDAAFFFINTLDEERKKRFSLYTTHRLKHKKGNVFLVSNHYKPLMTDDNGNMWLVVCISTLATKNHNIESYVEIGDYDERYIFSSKKNNFIEMKSIKLTNKELVTLELSSQGFTSKEIALKENISVSTVKFHKHNILSKFNVQNMSEASSFAYLHNLL